MTDTKKAAHESSPKDSQSKDTSIRAQQARLLAALIELGSVNTLYCRDRLNVMHPGGRVMELRRMGHEITTERVTIRDRKGRPHFGVGRYVLIRLAQEVQP